MNKMNIEQFNTLKNGGLIKVGKNQIFIDVNFSDANENIFVVEQFEFTDPREGDMFSVVDGFDDFEKAYCCAKNPSLYIKKLNNR